MSEGKESVTDFLSQMETKKEEASKMDVLKQEPKPEVKEEIPEEITPKPEVKEEIPEYSPKSFLEYGDIRRVKNLTDVKEIQLDLVDIEPLEVPEINDSRGLLSGKVARFMKEYNLSVVPLKALGFSDRIKTLKEFTVAEFGGQRFAFKANHTNDRQAILQYAYSIRDKYASCGEVDESIMKDIIVEGKTYTTIRFNHYELSLLSSALRNFGFVCYEDLNGDIRINVGGGTI